MVKNFPTVYRTAPATPGLLNTYKISTRKIEDQPFMLLGESDAFKLLPNKENNYSFFIEMMWYVVLAN